MGLIAPLLETPAIGLLDAYQANLWFAGGINAMLGGFPWAFPATNSLTAKTSHVPFRDRSVNQGALLADAGTTATAFLTTHDASNQGRYFAGPAGNNFPNVVASSAYLGWFQFDGVDDCFVNQQNLPATSGATIFLKGKLRGTSSLQILVELSTNFNSNEGFVAYYDNSISRLVLASHMSTGGRYAISEHNVTVTTDSVWCFRFDRSQTTGAAQCVLFLNGTKQTRTGATGETSPVPSGNFGSLPVYVGGRGAASLFAGLNLKTLAIYTSPLSDSDCTAISALL